MRQLAGSKKALAYGLFASLLLLALIHQFSVPIIGRVLYQREVVGVALALVASFTFIAFGARKGASKSIPWYDWILAALGAGGGLLLGIFGERISEQGWMSMPPLYMVVIGSLFIPLVLEACRRGIGLTVTVLVVIVLLYSYFGHHLPGILTTLPISYERFIGYFYVGTEGVGGVGTRLLVGILMAFFCFAAALQYSGLGERIVGMAQALLGRMAGGSSKVTVAVALLVGCLCGTGAGDVALTGPVTVPNMRKAGYSKDYAGGVISVAASGAVLTPPVMGIVAFIMAEFLGVSYLEVILVALIPASLFYWSLFTQVDFYARRHGFRGMEASEVPSFFKELKGGGWFVVAVLALFIVLIGYFRFEAKGAYFASVPLLIWGLTRDYLRGGLGGLIRSPVRFLEALMGLLGRLSPALIAISMLAGGIALTGVAQGFASFLTSSIHNPWLIMLIAAIVAYIMGTSIGILIIYIVLAILVVPVLVNLGFDPFAVHLGLIYWALISYLTPPYGIAVITTIAVTGGNYIRTCLHAMRMGISLLILPFLFMRNPALIAQEGGVQLFVNLVAALVFLVLLSAVIEGYFPKVGELSLRVRFMIAAAALLMASFIVGFGIVLIIIGVFLAAGTLGYQYALNKDKAKVGVIEAS